MLYKDTIVFRDVEREEAAQYADMIVDTINMATLGGPAAKGPDSAGICTFPDVCLTPPEGPVEPQKIIGILVALTSDQPVGQPHLPDPLAITAEMDLWT